MTPQSNKNVHKTFLLNASHIMRFISSIYPNHICPTVAAMLFQHRKETLNHLHGSSKITARLVTDAVLTLRVPGTGFGIPGVGTLGADGRV